MRGADVGARGHHGDVGGDRDHEAGRCRARAGGADEDHHRRPRRDHARHDRARGIEQAAGCAQDEHHHLGAGRVRPVDGLDQVFSGNGVNNAVEFGDKGERPVWCLGARGQTGPAGGEERRHEHRATRARHGGIVAWELGAWGQTPVTSRLKVAPRGQEIREGSADPRPGRSVPLGEFPSVPPQGFPAHRRPASCGIGPQTCLPIGHTWGVP